ncbi:hypothetical protein KR200_008575 [Drosophila serrata]|nr:hypothetical protein KR200_008575 [Drosophila serrata]
MFALLQEPYLGVDGMDVLPEGARMFTDRRGKTAVIVDQRDAICMPVETLTNEFGVCLVVKGSFGSIFLCSAYCQFDAPLEPYLRYMDAVLLHASRTPAILGLDANAVSPMWFSKLFRHAEGQANYSRVESIAAVPSWKFSNASWRLFEEEMVRRAADIPENLSESPLDQQLSTLRRIVHDVCDVALGRKAPGSPSRRARWWTADLCAARREVRRLRRRLQDARRRDVDVTAELLLVELRRALADYKKLIWRAKIKDWKRFVGSHSDDPWGRVYKICRGRRKYTEIGCLRVNGELITDWDGINGTICKAVWRAIPQHLASSFSRCIRSGYFPTEWKCPRVVALLKGPEKDKCEPSSYRGICLLPVFGKVIEAIMVNRVREVLPEGCRWQFGFRQGRCVEDAWRHVKSTVDDSPAQYVLGIFVDFKGAFDNVEWSAALLRLADLGCREMSLWQSFFSGQTAMIRSSYGTVNVPVTRGCPQGSISGSFIWDFQIDVLLQRLESYGPLSAYADDLILLVEGNSQAVLEEKGAQLMSIVETWGAEIGVAVSTSKTVITLLKVSTAALQVLAVAPPLNLAAKQLAVKYKLKRGFPLEEND